MLDDVDRAAAPEQGTFDRGEFNAREVPRRHVENLQHPFTIKLDIDVDVPGLQRPRRVGAEYVDSSHCREFEWPAVGAQTLDHRLEDPGCSFAFHAAISLSCQRAEGPMPLPPDVSVPDDRL